MANSKSIGRELANVPFPDMIKGLGEGIANAQYELDKASIKIAYLLAGYEENEKGELIRDKNLDIILDGKSYNLIELGFTPTFYQFVDTYIELKMAISMQEQTEMGGEVKAGGGFLCFAASVTASYSQKYDYSVEGSSMMRTKLVTVPAPAVIEQKLKDMHKLGKD